MTTPDSHIRRAAIPADGPVQKDVPRRSRRWAYVFIGLLVVHAGSMITMAVIASSDASFAVEPNYYEQALGWDAAAAQRAQNEQLGWSVEVGVEAAEAGSSGEGERELRVRLLDAHGRPLDGGAVHVQCFHHARSASRIAAELHPRGDGWYSAALVIDRHGLWEVRLNVQRGPEVFTQRVQISVAPGTHGTEGDGAP